MSGRRSAHRGHGLSTPRRYPRTARVNEVLREVLADALEKVADQDDRLGLLTITAVDSDPDLRHARVYFAHLEADRRAALEDCRVRLQAAVAAEVRLKRTPSLSFAPDPAVSTGERVEEILRHLQASPQREEADGEGG